MSDAGNLTAQQPLIRAKALAHVIFERRDPETMGRFLVDFGFVASDNGYYRAHAAGRPWAVRIVKSETDAFAGLAFEAKTEQDLEIFAAATGGRIDRLEGPGGGKVTKATDPDGTSVELVFGSEPVAALSSAENSYRANRHGKIERVNQAVRPPVEAAPVFKLGHVVLQTTQLAETSAWYAHHFGLLASDLECLDDGTPVLGFYRLDLGDEPADHHTLALLSGGTPSLLHVSTETSTLDALGQGQRHLRQNGWTHYWGIGRHELGSQIFDYWKDPVGDEWEHYIDGDMMDASYPTGRRKMNRGGLWSWGQDLPDSMRPDLPLEAIPEIHKAGGFGSMTLEQATQFILSLQSPPRPWLL